MIFRFLIFLFLICSVDSVAQTLFYSNGARIVNTTTLKINGTFRNDNNGIFQQAGSMHVTGDFVNNATFNNAGNISLEGNFIQNGTLNAETSGTLLLIGGNQNLQGDSTIYLNHIAALGSGKKELLRNVQTKTLALNDREINANNFILFISASNTAALTRTTGFVSAALNGALKRKLASNSSYLFPLGWNSIYSPINISIPTDTADIEARFASADASAEGLPRSFVDSTICSTNPSFYHLVNGNAPYTLSIQLDAALTPPFTHVCTRALNGTGVWQVDNSFNFTTAGSITTLASNSTGELNRAFLLCSKRPQQPTISGDNAVCEMVNATTYQAGNFGNNSLIWSAEGGQIQGSAVAPFVDVTWTSSQLSALSLTATDANGCSSFPTIFQVTVLPVPTAEIISITPTLPFEDQVYTFINNSPNAPFFSWKINDEGPFIDSVLLWTFDSPGEYLITLLVTNNEGCSDTAQKKITITEGVIFPNAFSPNGDGINDALTFTNSGLENFSVIIFDRWGTVVFETNFPKLNWNGRDVSGELVPAGTYFYLLAANSSKNKYEKRGSISIYY